jgi:hypothetical protein
MRAIFITISSDQDASGYVEEDDLSCNASQRSGCTLGVRLALAAASSAT